MMIESSDFIIHFSLLIPRQSDKAFYHIHFINYHIQSAEVFERRTYCAVHVFLFHKITQTFHFAACTGLISICQPVALRVKAAAFGLSFPSI